MHRIDEPGNIAGQFTLGNPATGTPPTRIGADWPNAVQEEICAVIAAAGITLDKEDQAQLLAAIQTLMSAGSAEVGEPRGFFAETPPDGWLEADGSAVSRATYAALFAAIGVMFGNGDGSTTFNLPDLRGRFLRGWDHGAGVDPDAASRADRGDGTTGDHVGTKQAHALEEHEHKLDVGVDTGSDQMAYKADNVSTTLNPLPNNVVATAGAHVANVSQNETRPVNIAVMWCVKY